MLSAIELPEFIVQLFSSGHKERVEFWFIRNKTNMKFLFDEERGLISINYEGFCVSEEFRHHRMLPWSQKDEVNCLILKKMDNNIKNCMQNENMLLVPYNKIARNGGAIISTDYRNTIEIFAYSIHDNFRDFRARNKTSQMFIACFVASFCGKIVSSTLNLTNE